jgi:hypothetical protein
MPTARPLCSDALGVIIDFELSSLPPKPAHLEAIRRVLEERNVEFVEDTARLGAGRK